MTAILGQFHPSIIIGFFAMIFLFLVIDLKAHKADKPVTIRNAAMWSAIWIGLAMCFAGFIWSQYGSEKSSLFLAGYFLEKSLSVDNLFVIMAVFASFTIKEVYQHRTLYYGILGALVLRMLFIAFGTSLAMISEWVMILFGALVLWTAYKMALVNEAEGEMEDYSNHFSVRWTRRFFTIYPRVDSHNFFVRKDKKWLATPLLLTLVCIEVSDIIFAFDSVPAVIAITQDPILVYTSNIFAILGLRSLYFLLVAAKGYLIHLEKAVVVILVFIGLKMIILPFHWMHISANVSLAVVLGCLAIGILASIVFPEKPEAEEAPVTPAN